MGKGEGKEDLFVRSVLEDSRPGKFYKTSEAGFRKYGEITEDNRRVRGM